MIIPVRCFTCGKVIGSEWQRYLQLLSGGKDAREALDDLRLERYCCRRMILSHVDLIDDVIPFG
ncbi:MAG: DNA-directed RNA polymerase subunit N [Candidatus Thermoplasmatota archaeon]|nr:DNA-directed RNA polymerase subunit N [Candidatus Thermoplasmatota archaeon]